MSDAIYEKECNPDAWWDDRSLPVKILMGFGFGIAGAGLLFLFGLIVKALWNWLMPEIFGLKAITYWQAWGLLVLSCILFGKLGSGGSRGNKTERKRKKYLRDQMKKEEPTEQEGPDLSPEG